MSVTMRKAEWKEPWFVASAIGLGCALASTECERYTALWNFDTRSVWELLWIVAFLIVGVGAALCYKKRRTTELFACSPLVAALGIVQAAAIAGRASGALPDDSAAFIAASLGTQCSAFTLLLFAEFHLKTGIRKSMTSLAAAFVIAGLIQMLALLVPAPAARWAVAVIPLAAAALLSTATHMRSGTACALELEDIEAEPARPPLTGRSKGISFASLCLSLFLLDVLLIALHNQAMILQDGAAVSASIQLFSSLGSIAAGSAFLLAMGSLHEHELMEALRLLVVPLALVALYLDMETGGGALGIHMVLLGLCYAVLILLVWAQPRRILTVDQAFGGTCLAYLAYRMGWAAGIFAIMLVPQIVDGLTYEPVIVLAIAALLALSAAQVVGLVRAAGNPQSPKRERGQETSATDPFEAACDSVADAHGLSPREREVLSYLARGRNARFISGALMIADGTARGHIVHIYQKLGVRSQQALMDVVDKELHRAELASGREDG